MDQEEIRREVNRGFEREHAVNDSVAISIPRIHSWGDVMSVVTLAGLLIGGVVWGMKLEGRYDTLEGRISTHRTEVNMAVDTIRTEVSATRADIQEVKALLQRGVLPVTEVRLQSLENRIHQMEGVHGHPAKE